LRVIDFRANKTVSEVESHQGNKGSRVCWFGKLDKIFTVGSSKASDRQWMLWDPRNMEKPIAEQNMDNGAGLMMPFFDEDTSVLYLPGKGDVGIRYFEVVPDSPYLHHIETFRGNKAQIGMASVPKYSLDTSVCEVTRLLKLQSSEIIPISFCVPRKSTLFQDDIYPDTRGPTGSITAEEYFGGKDGHPVLISLNPKVNKDLHSSLVVTEFKSTQVVTQQTPKMPNKVTDPKRLAEQNEEFRLRVLKLEKEKSDLKLKIIELKKTIKEFRSKS